MIHGDQALFMVHPFCREGLLGGPWNLGETVYAGAVWPVNNLAILVPIILEQPTIFLHGLVNNGSPANGNLDVGLYADDGNGSTATRLCANGGTAQSGTNTTQTLTFTATTAGSHDERRLCYIAVAANSAATLPAIIRVAPANAAILGTLGVCQVSNAYPLPASVTFEAMAQTYLPRVALSARSFV